MRLAVAFVLALPGVSLAEDWPQFRGPRGDGVSGDNGVPLKWSIDENVKWKAAVPGAGHSSPIVVNGRVFVTTCLETKNERVLLCYDRSDGKLLWQKVVAVAPLETRHAGNTCASSTPAADGRHVWVTFLDDGKWLFAFSSG